MKTLSATLLLVSLVFSVNAQVSFDAMPKCALECLTTFVPQSPCSSTDLNCICTNEVLMSNITTCVLGSCTVMESLTAKNMTMAACGAPVRDHTSITPILTGVSGSLAIIALGFRVGVRFPNWRATTGLDDFFIVLALATAIPMAILEFMMSKDGFGKDIWTIPFDKVTRIVKFTYLTEILYMAATALTKMSFLYFYLRVFPSQEFRRTAYIVLAFTGAFLITFVVATSLQCLPVSYTWHSWTGAGGGKCFNLHVFAIWHAALNIALDLTVIILPIPQLVRLSMGLRKKVHLCLMFCIGFFITIVSMIRLRSLVVFATSTNPTWDDVGTAYWSVLETFVGIICACLPMVRALLRNVFPRCFGSTQANSYYDDSRGIRVSKMPSSNLSGNIAKTVQVSVSHVSKGEESDEMHLVDLQPDGRRGNYDREW